MSKQCLAFVLGWVATTAMVAVAEDWPQYRGPRRDDVSTETGLLKEWPKGGPELRWTYKDCGLGYSGPAVVGSRVYTLGDRGETAFLIALDIAAPRDGAVTEAWATPIGAKFDWQGNRWSAGPSATPTVDGDLIFALGGMGDLACVEATTGKERWRKHLPKDLAAQVNPIGGGPKGLGWGFTWSPLVDGERLICVPGGPQGTLAALNKHTGEVLWRSTELTDQAAYTSPMVAEIEGQRQYVVLTNQGLAGINPADGKLLWTYRRKPAYSTEVVNTPIIRGSQIYVTVGAGQGCELLQITREGETFAAQSVYSNKNMTNHHGNVALVGEHLFGFSEGKGWICQSWDNGETVWAERGKLRAGALTCAEGRLYCYGEDDGLCALVAASPEGWKEHGRFPLPEKSSSKKPNGKIWTPPIVANGQLFLRDQELLFCFDVRETR